MRKVSSTYITEMVITLILFELGSTTLFLIGGDAKQDAWIAMSLAAAAGFFLLITYLSIYQRGNERDLFELLKQYMGKVLGTLIGLSFVGYFTYELSRNLRDLGELTVMTLLDRTPLLFIMAIAIAVVGNTTRYGPRTLFLTSLALFPIIVVSYALLGILIPGKGLIQLKYMFPVLEHGWKPVLDAAFPEIVSFPFGQLVLFLVFFSLVKPDKSKKLSKAVLISYVVIAIFLITFNQADILVLGPELASNITLPLLQTVQLIELAKVFERLDPLFVIIFFLGLGIKMAAFYNGAVLGMEKITGIKHKIWVILIGAISYVLAMWSPNYSHHLQVGLKYSVLIYPLFQIVIPLILLGLMLLRRKKSIH